MRLKLASTPFPFWFLTLSLFALAGQGAHAAGSTNKIQVLLVWATNLESTNKPVEVDIKKKLSELPLKWANYFEINRKVLAMPLNGSMKAPLSDKCEVEVKNLGSSAFEVGVLGKTEQVVRRNLTLPKGQIVTLTGGNAPDSAGWLVVVKRLE
jgi:hypothetical protein